MSEAQVYQNIRKYWKRTRNSHQRRQEYLRHSSKFSNLQYKLRDEISELSILLNTFKHEERKNAS